MLLTLLSLTERLLNWTGGLFFRTASIQFFLEFQKLRDFRGLLKSSLLHPEVYFSLHFKHPSLHFANLILDCPPSYFSLHLFTQKCRSVASKVGWQADFCLKSLENDFKNGLVDKGPFGDGETPPPPLSPLVWVRHSWKNNSFDGYTIIFTWSTAKLFCFSQNFPFASNNFSTKLYQKSTFYPKKTYLLVGRQFRIGMLMSIMLTFSPPKKAVILGSSESVGKEDEEFLLKENKLIF